jgi:prepilin peptidase dependent protein A/type IV fimbrial biogenesis protein FimT
MKDRLMHHNNAFSLINILISLSIISLLITQAIPSFLEFRHFLTLKSSAIGTYFLFQKGRSHAIKQQQTVYISLHEGEKWCVGITDDVDCDCQLAHSCLIDDIETIVSADDYPKIEMHSLKFADKTSSRFEPTRGLTSGYAGSFVLASERDQLKFIVSNIGRLRICALTPPIANYPEC